MRNTLCSMVFAGMMLLGAVQSQAEDVKHFQLSLFNPVQIYDAATSIHGLRLSIYGVNEDVMGADLGFVTVVNGDMKGWQHSAVAIVKGDMTGYQDAIVCITEGEFVGLQGGLVNISKSRFTGLQAAFVNKTKDMHGVQFGIINLTDTLYGIQIGLANVITSGQPREFFPIVNFAF